MIDDLTLSNKTPNIILNGCNQKFKYPHYTSDSKGSLDNFHRSVLLSTEFFFFCERIYLYTHMYIGCRRCEFIFLWLPYKSCLADKKKKSQKKFPRWFPSRIVKYDEFSFPVWTFRRDCAFLMPIIFSRDFFFLLLEPTTTTTVIYCGCKNEWNYCKVCVHFSDIDCDRFSRDFLARGKRSVLSRKASRYVS